MKRVLVAAAALLALACAGAARADVFNYSLPGGPLVVQPNAQTEEYQASLVIDDLFTVEDVNLTLHGFTARGLVEVVVLLSYLPQGFDPFDTGAPEATTVVLLNQLGLVFAGDPPSPSVGGDFTFDDEAPLPITALVPPDGLALRSGGAFRPQSGALATLDGFSSSSQGGILVAGGSFPTPGPAWLLTIRSTSSAAGSTLGAFESATLSLTGTLAGQPVPEPATWAMMLTGFLGVGALLRRSRAARA